MDFIECSINLFLFFVTVFRCYFFIMSCSSSDLTTGLWKIWGIFVQEYIGNLDFVYRSILPIEILINSVKISILAEL